MEQIKKRKKLYGAIFVLALVYAIYTIFFVYAPDFTQIKIIWAGPIAGMVGLLYSALKENKEFILPSLALIILPAAYYFLKGPLELSILVFCFLIFCFFIKKIPIAEFDLITSFFCLLTAGIALGSINLALLGAFLILTLAVSGLFSGILADLAVKKGQFAPSLLIYSIFSYYLIEKIFLPGYIGIFYAALTGVLLSFLIEITNKNKKDNTGLILGLLALFSLFAFYIAGGMSSYSVGFWGIGLMGASCFAINNKKTALCLSSSIASVLLYVAFSLEMNFENVDILNPFVLFGVLFGAALACFTNKKWKYSISFILTYLISYLVSLLAFELGLNVFMGILSGLLIVSIPKTVSNEDNLNLSLFLKFMLISPLAFKGLSVLFG